jgi:hypothetical protein
LRPGAEDLLLAGFALDDAIDLSVSGGLGEDYEASTIAYKLYESSALPDDDTLLSDLEAVIAAYESYLQPARSERREAANVLLVGAAPADAAAKDLETYGPLIRSQGAAALWWSYPLNDEATAALRVWPYLYVYAGQPKQQLVHRFHIVEWRTSTGDAGIECPWPELVNESARDLTRAGSAKSQIFKTWFRANAIETIEPPIGLGELERADGTEIVVQGLLNGFGLWRLRTTALADNDTIDDGYEEPAFAQIASSLAADGIVISEQLLRRYHISLKSRGFVILSGVSGTGKTWLTEAYAKAVGAKYLLVPVAPNWTTNEDLLGYFNPVTQVYHNTDFTVFLKDAGDEYLRAKANNVQARPYHLVLDEMNLARIEYYFAKFLSQMEVRARSQAAVASIALSDTDSVLLTPNLYFTGTVNIDETTHGFADKVFDRAQLIELEIDRDAVIKRLDGIPHASTILEIWDALVHVAPFAFRVIDEMRTYVDLAVTDSPGGGDVARQAIDEQILQKVLPKIRGTDPRLREALTTLKAITSEAYPLSHAKVSRMLEDFVQHEFVSYF